MTNTFKIIDDDEAEKAQFFVCMRVGGKPLLMADNLVGTCTECGEQIQFRPHGPTKPKKVCMECAMPIIEDQAAKGKFDAMATTKTLDDLKKYRNQTNKKKLN